jgi:hypothetical protein
VIGPQWGERLFKRSELRRVRPSCLQIGPSNGPLNLATHSTAPNAIEISALLPFAQSESAGPIACHSRSSSVAVASFVG